MTVTVRMPSGRELTLPARLFLDLELPFEPVVIDLREGS